MAFSTAQLNEQLVIVKRESARYSIPWLILWGVYGVETTHGANVTTSSAGAKGPYQFIEGTAKQYGYPYTNEYSKPIFEKQTAAAAHYLSDLYKQHGSWEGALRAYSGGGYGYAKVQEDAKGLQTVESPLGPIVKGSPLAGPAEAINAATSWTKDLGNILHFIGSSSGWVRIGKVVLGAGFLVIAISELTKISPSVPSVNGVALAKEVIK